MPDFEDQRFFPPNIPPSAPPPELADEYFDPHSGPEPFRRDAYAFYTGHIESRILVDPAWLHFGDPLTSAMALVYLARYARSVSTPTKVELLYPGYLKPNDRRYSGAFLRDDERRDVGPPSDRSESAKLETVFESSRAAYRDLVRTSYGEIAKGKEPEGDQLERLRYGSELFERPDGMDLLLISSEQRCDYLITGNPWLLEHSTELRKNGGVWIGRAEEIIDLLQLSLRAAGVFYEAVRPLNDHNGGDFGRMRVSVQGLGFSSFYSMENPDLFRYQRWFDTVRRANPDNKVFAHGRAAFHLRFPFLLYAHDLLRYHARYAERFETGNHYREDHRFHVAYHLNAFYVMVAALLDNVAWLWNYYFQLGFKETDSSRNKCVLTDREFRKRIRPHLEEFVNLLTNAKYAEWLQNLTFKRHPAVHREPLFLTQIVEEGTGRVLTDSASIVEDAQGYRIFDLLSHADHDRGLLLEFVDAMVSLKLPRPVTPTAKGSSS